MSTGPGPRPGSCQIQHLETASSRIVTIATKCDDANFAICHSQHQSPLFALPKELRLMIYEFVAIPKAVISPVEYNQSSVSFSDAHVGHADFSGCTSFSPTCRLAWLESGILAVSSAVVEVNLACHDEAGRVEIHDRLRRLTSLNTSCLLGCRITLRHHAIRPWCGCTAALTALMSNAPIFTWPGKMEVVIPLDRYKCQNSVAHLWMVHAGRPSPSVIDHQKLCHLRRLKLDLKVPASYLDLEKWMAVVRNADPDCHGWLPADISMSSELINDPGSSERKQETMSSGTVNIEWRRPGDVARAAVTTSNTGSLERQRPVRATEDTFDYPHRESDRAIRTLKRRWSKERSLLQLLNLEGNVDPAIDDL